MITNGVTNARISTSTTHATRYTDTFRRYDNIYTLLIVGIGILLPYTPLAGQFGFTPLPLLYFLFLAGMTATYLLLVELVKRQLMSRWVK